MGQLAPIVSAVIRDQGAVVTSSDDGAAAQDPRSCSGDFEFTDLRTESGRGLGHPAAPRGRHRGGACAGAGTGRAARGVVDQCRPGLDRKKLR